MYSMNEVVRLRLADYLGASKEGWGNEQGREVYAMLLRAVEQHPSARVFEISLEGVKRTDASFPRESVVELARRFRKQLGFVISDVAHDDLLFNWFVAADKKQQPLFVKGKSGWDLIGGELSPAKKSLLDYVMANKAVRTSEVAADLGLKTTNASTQLKDLWEMGYVLRHEEAADTGGVEFVYTAIP